MTCGVACQLMELSLADQCRWDLGGLDGWNGLEATFECLTIKNPGLKKATHCGAEWLAWMEHFHGKRWKARVPVKKTALKRHRGCSDPCIADNLRLLCFFCLGLGRSLNPDWGFHDDECWFQCWPMMVQIPKNGTQHEHIQCLHQEEGITRIIPQNGSHVDCDQGEWSKKHGHHVGCGILVCPGYVGWCRTSPRKRTWWRLSPCGCVGEHTYDAETPADHFPGPLVWWPTCTWAFHSPFTAIIWTLGWQVWCLWLWRERRAAMFGQRTWSPCRSIAFYIPLQISIYIYIYI